MSGTYWVVRTESLNVSKFPPAPNMDTFIDVAQDRDVTVVSIAVGPSDHRNGT